MENKQGFEQLNKINVNDMTEKKNGLTYLSWAHAWAEFCKIFPNATYEVKMFDGKPYVFDENLGYMVFTTVHTGTDEDPKSMQLPVMDGANKAQKNVSYTYKVKEYKDGKWTGSFTDKTVEQATMFDINTAIMRCMVKNLAMYGLGLYIYQGEDLPDDGLDHSQDLPKVTGTRRI